MSGPLPTVDQQLYWALENCLELLKLRSENPRLSGPAFTISIRQAEKALRRARGEAEDSAA